MVWLRNVGCKWKIEQWSFMAYAALDLSMAQSVVFLTQKTVIPGSIAGTGFDIRSDHILSFPLRLMYGG